MFLAGGIPWLLLTMRTTLANNGGEKHQTPYGVYAEVKWKARLCLEAVVVAAATNVSQLRVGRVGKEKTG